MSLYLKNARFIDWQSLKIQSANIKVDEGVSGGISFVDSIPPSGGSDSSVRVIDCKGKFVTKAFGCGHHHIYSH